MTDQETQENQSSEDKSINHPNKNEDEIFSMTEIKIEEMAIDGICGVYQNCLEDEYLNTFSLLCYNLH